MTSHLLVLSIGPVQGFIAAARRTRDLWFGSNLLSEISKAAAKAVQDRGTLIFPAPADPRELNPGSALNVANILLAELTDADPREVASKAKEAAERYRLGIADDVLRRRRGVIREEIWRGQVEDVIEFHAAWLPFVREKYADIRKQLMRLLAGRKMCRDFLPAFGRAGVPKSSLDGLRESVLKNPKEEPWPAGARRGLRVKEGEQLCAVGLVKRDSGSHRPYPSVSRIAADPWIKGIVKAFGEAELAQLCQACKELGGDVMHDLNTAVYPQYAAFPYEGTAVFCSRHHELREEAGFPKDGNELQPLTEALSELTRKAGEPNPYLAVLVADGDHIGAALSNLDSPEKHRAFSQKLAQFAGEARKIVVEHCGVLVYSGGDDVLAFVPVHKCLGCARALHQKFGDLMRPWEEAATPVSLSVGVAIAHFLEDLEDLLNYGREAEGHAKHKRAEDGNQDDRNGLAVHLLKRGGGPITVRANWTDTPDSETADLDRRIAHFANCINSGAIPGRVAYDLRRLAGVYDHEKWQADFLARAIRGDARRVIRAKQPRGESKMKDIRELDERVKDAGSLRLFADEILVARQIAAALRQAAGRPAGEEVFA